MNCRRRHDASLAVRVARPFWASLLVTALTLSPGWSAPALVEAPAAYRVEVIVTGRHPRGDSWDGTDGHAVVFRVALSSPPELRLVVVTESSARFVGESGDSPGSPCPDAEHCVFDVENLPETSPFALVVLDDDRREVTADAVVEKVEAGAGRLRALAARVLSEGESGRSSDEGDVALPVGSEKAVATALRLGGSEHDLVVAQLFLPQGGASKEALDAIHERVRTLVDELADSWSSKAKSRVSGRLPARALEECLWPAPACDFTYAQIGIEAPSDY